LDQGLAIDEIERRLCRAPEPAEPTRGYHLSNPRGRHAVCDLEWTITTRACMMRFLNVTETLSEDPR
jgi:hypothetical protein